MRGARHAIVNGAREDVTIHGERRSARDARLVGRPEHDRPEAAHFRF
jgi:hypothetical protein